MAGKDQTLPGKDNAQFRNVVKLYETKQYKKGIKTADQLLKKYSEHGETLAMKGLILNSTGKREEAYDFTRRGLKCNLKSFVCWHVYGLICRSDANYDEAIKCYKNALRLDKDNLTILRDLAVLQVQMRDVSGYIESRQQLLSLKPSSRQNWLSMAIAHHMNGRPEVAAQVLGAYENVQEEVDPKETYEHSEMLLYKAQLLVDAKQLDEALEHLDSSRRSTVDKIGARELRGSILLQLERNDEAEQIYRKLVKINPDNYRYHEGLRTAIHLPAGLQAPVTENQRAELQRLYAELQHSYPSSPAVRRIALDFLVGEDFEAAAERHVQRFLDREVPSLFSDVRPLYRDAAKQEALQLLFERLHSSAQASSTGQDGSGQPAADDSFGPLPWTKLYLAQHYDHIGDTGKAASLLQEAIQGAPKLIELHSALAKVLKHAGNLAGAADAAVHAQSLDLADRYLSNTAAKYLFRADKLDDAQRMATRFTKDGEHDNNLHDMQCTWYEIENGQAHLRQHAHGKALKNFQHVRKHFEDFREDQFDFHTYCTRKMTLRSYMQMLRMQDRLYQNAAFSKAAWGAIEAYLQLHAAQHAPASAAAHANGVKDEELSPEDRKKLKQRQRKEAQKHKKEEQQKEKQEAANATASSQKAAAGAGAKKEQDPDPDGKELASVPDPLAEAAKLVKVLRDNAGDRLETHKWAFEVYTRKGRVLLALQAVKRALALAGRQHADVHSMLVRLCQHMGQASAAEQASADPLVQQLIQEQVAELLQQSSLADYCSAYVAEPETLSLAQRLAAAQALAEVQPEHRSRAVQLLLDDLSQQGHRKHAECVAAHHLLLQQLSDGQAAQQWHDACQHRFQHSTYFSGAEATQIDLNGLKLDSLTVQDR